MTGWSENGLLQCWRALAQTDGEATWRFMHVAAIGLVDIKAGCHFPGGRESLIVSFPAGRAGNLSGLSDGKGFDIVTIRDDSQFHGRVAIALVRRPEGSLDIFSIMATDVLRYLDAIKGRQPRELAEAFLSRVAEWQAFMARKRRPLSALAQLGLMGELWFLDQLVQGKLGASAIDCWQGPLHAAQDFLIGTGAIEVKSSLADTSFLAQINSIEQLDSDRDNTWLLALRFEETDQGINLVSLVANLRNCAACAGMTRAFEALLLLAGYDDDHSGHYARKLRQCETRAYRVGSDFPCLRRAEVPAPVRKARYVLDLDALEQPATPFDNLLHSFGLVKDEP
jgi:hypothetical protein